MNYRFLGLIAGLTLTAGIVSCSATPTTEQATPVPAATAGKPADAMKNDAMKGDAMKNDAMKGDAMKNDAMKGDAMKNEKPADAPVVR